MGSTKAGRGSAGWRCALALALALAAGGAWAQEAICSGAAAALSLPRARAALAAKRALTIVALGSSSTQGVGARDPANAYPARLQFELRADFPGADIRVLNRGVGGETAEQMIGRIGAEVAPAAPDLVIWQVGSNAALRGEGPNALEAQLADGFARLAATGADVVVMTPQFAPRIEASGRGGSMSALIERVAGQAGVGVFARRRIMQGWREGAHLPFETFLIDDGLHMNDWGYRCIAHLLADQVAEGLRGSAPQKVGARR